MRSARRSREGTTSGGIGLTVITMFLAVVSGVFRDVVELRFGSRQAMTLVRPDGYVAYSAPGRDGIAALKAVQALLERQTK